MGKIKSLQKHHRAAADLYWFSNAKVNENTLKKTYLLKVL